MRDQNGGATLHDSAQAIENAFFSLGVDARERVVEDQNAWIADNGSRNRGALLLSAGESDAALADHGFVGCGEVLDVAMQAGNFGCFADALLVIVRQAEGDVAADGFAKQVGILRHKTDGLAQGSERPLANGTAVDSVASMRPLPSSREESGRGGFGACGWVSDGGGLTAMTL